MFLVETHRFLRYAGPVVGEFGLKLLHLGLQGAHRLHLPALFQAQREHCPTHDNREYDDAEPEVVEKNEIQEHQAVYHRPDDDLVPKDANKLQDFALIWLPS